MPDDPTMTPKQAAAIIGVSDQTIYNWIAVGVFKDVTKRGILKPRYFIPVREVERVKHEGNYEGHDYGLVASA